MNFSGGNNSIVRSEFLGLCTITPEQHVVISDTIPPDVEPYYVFRMDYPMGYGIVRFESILIVTDLKKLWFRITIEWVDGTTWDAADIMRAILTGPGEVRLSIRERDKFRELITV